MFACTKLTTASVSHYSAYRSCHLLHLQAPSPLETLLHPPQRTYFSCVSSTSWTSYASSSCFHRHHHPPLALHPWSLPPLLRAPQPTYQCCHRPASRNCLLLTYPRHRHLLILIPTRSTLGPRPPHSIVPPLAPGLHLRVQVAGCLAGGAWTCP